MYKVFRDPEGTHSLDHSTVSATNKTATLQHSNELETYKQRIQSLNVEVIRLNDELEMVTISAYTNRLITYIQCNTSSLDALAYV